MDITKTPEDKKMGFFATLFTFIKLNIVAGFLFLPAGFLAGGWLFSIIALIVILTLNVYTMISICECSERINSYSLSKIGGASMGKFGYYLCECGIAFIQVNVFPIFFYHFFFIFL